MSLAHGRNWLGLKAGTHMVWKDVIDNPSQDHCHDGRFAPVLGIMILDKFQDTDAAPDHDRPTALRAQILENISANQSHIRELRCR